VNVSGVYELRDVRRQHGPAFALEIDRLEVRAGEVLALVGPTGAGKSTLLRLLAGLDAPERGSLRFDGGPFEAPNLPLSVLRRITMVHQRPLPLAGSVRFNVEYGLRLRNRRGFAVRVDALLDRLGLTRIAARSAAMLSGGEMQLVAVARALVVDPDVLLLDEPTAHLDPARVGLVEETVREAWRDRGTTIVWATHNHFQARRVADRTALLLGGRIVEAAATDLFFDDPSDPRTADFVQGRMVY
jgi:tungstate transport system ATP-binding protein